MVGSILGFNSMLNGGFFGISGGFNSSGSGENPISQMMMASQLMTGGQSYPAQGMFPGMDGMSGMMGTFSPMLGNNISNFLGGPGGMGGQNIVQMMMQMMMMMMQMMQMMMGGTSQQMAGGMPGAPGAESGTPGIENISAPAGFAPSLGNFLGTGGSPGGLPAGGEGTTPGGVSPLENAPSASAAPPISGGQEMGKAKGTGYYPDNSAMEGGYNDMKGKKLNTLQDVLEGKAETVSIALDKNLYKSGKVKYGDKFRIPELEKKYGRPIIFSAVDTGGAFTNKGFGRVDICTRSAQHASDSTVNGNLTLIKVG